ncbi:MAG TPA: hypothetical protein VGP93_01520, partial [Polyangiaceae bacterium]|nr:hypothetical protein [Polyangiaceae bacterium]
MSFSRSDTAGVSTTPDGDAKRTARVEVVPMVAAVAGLLALCVGRAPRLALTFALPSALLCIAAPRLRRRATRVPWTWITFGLCVAAAVGAQLVRDPWPMGLLLALAQVHRRITRVGAQDDRLTLAIAGGAVAFASSRAGVAMSLILAAGVVVSAAAVTLSRDTRRPIHPLLAFVVGVGLSLGAGLLIKKRTSGPNNPYRLVLVAQSLPEPTDIQFPPGRSDRAVVLGQAGDAWVVDAHSGKVRNWFHADVYMNMECGLLGLAFHPGFPKNPRFYVDQCVRRGQQTFSQVVEWKAPNGLDEPPVVSRTVLELEQPWDNHKGGQLR